MVHEVYGKLGFESQASAVLLRAYFMLHREGIVSMQEYLKSLLRTDSLSQGCNDLLFTESEPEITSNLMSAFDRQGMAWPSDPNDPGFLERVALGSFRSGRISAEALVRFCYQEVWRRSEADPEYLIWCRLDDDLDAIESGATNFRFLLRGDDVHQAISDALLAAGKLDPPRPSEKNP